MDGINYILEDLINRGAITQEQFDKIVETKAKENEENPNSPQGKLKVTNGIVTNLDERTMNMQEIDYFTLDETFKINDRTQSMQDVDDFTLQLVFELQAKVDELELRLQTLEGGN